MDRIRIAAWTMLIAQAGIIFTGGIVRLTGSGLGCSDWPKCTPDSLVATPEMGLHGVIEFGNRLLAVVLALIGVAILVLLWRHRRQRPDLFWLNIGLTAIVPVQALMGGITVWTKLNPWVVAGHFVPSAIAVGVAAYFVRRTYDTGVRTAETAPSPLPALGWAILVLTAIIVFFGVLTTGAGPHSGSTISTRNGLDNITVTRLHALPVWLLVGTTITALIIARRRYAPMVAPLVVLLIAEIAQGLIGYVQYFLGVPVVLVALHMIGLSVTIAAAVAVLDSAYPRRRTRVDADRSVPVVH